MIQNIFRSFHPLATQEKAASQIDSTLNSNSSFSPQELKSLTNFERVLLKNIDRSEIEDFIQKYPQTVSLIKEEFLSDDLKAKINLQKMNSLQLNTPVQKEPSKLHSIFSSSNKKRSRENNDEEEIINTRTILADKNSQKKLDAPSSSTLDLNNFKHKTNKYTFSKESKATENDPIMTDQLNTTIDLIDSDDDEYDFKVLKQNKRASILDNTKSIEVLDIVSNHGNENDDKELYFDISPDVVIKKKNKPKKTNLQLLMDS